MESRSGRVAATREEIDAILASTRNIAVVGLSKDLSKTSHCIAIYLRGARYRIIPVNPTADDQILGERAYHRLSEIPERIDLVDVFRPAGEALQIVRETAGLGIPVIWFQLGCASEEAVREAVDSGLCVVHDHCIMVEHRRYAQEQGR
jgi:predicted CoA-binding protein